MSDIQYLGRMHCWGKHSTLPSHAKRKGGRMPLQNRVTPLGEIVALPERGLLMGNRGILHDEDRRIVRPWQVQRWIACRTQFRERHRQVMQPHTYTELFFLDEATAFAAGHRPCAECRHSDYQRFRAAWATWYGTWLSAEQMDAILHSDRLEGRGRRTQQRKRTYQEAVVTLPDGAFIRLDGAPWLRWDGQLLAWSAGGYGARQLLPDGERLAEVLTPRALVAVLRAGYQVAVHPSAAAPARRL
jgi:hypothetical protein